MQLYSGFICALAGALLTFAFGLWNESLTVLTVLMGVDYITGVVASVRDGKGLSSSAGFWGLAKKGLVMLVIIIAHRIDLMMGTQVVMGAAVYFYIANELLSVIENYGRIGLPVPDKLRSIVRVLRNRADSDESDGK